MHGCKLYWVAVKEPDLSYYMGEAQVFTIYTHYGTLLQGLGFAQSLGLESAVWGSGCSVA